MRRAVARDQSGSVGLAPSGLKRITGNGMDNSSMNQFELRFQSLFDRGRGFAFPCDPTGQVDLDRLSERARNNYLYARAMVGRELSVPAVQCSAMH
jgi:hypothetical protein